jgi:type II secretory pathway pseudopilin PulG
VWCSRRSCFARNEAEGGFTLPEILVSALLILTVILIIYSLLATFQKYWVLTDARASCFLSVETASERIRREMRSSSFAGITDATASPLPALSFLSPRDADNRIVLDGSGGLQWQKHVIYYIRTDTGELMRREVPATGPTPLPPAVLRTYCDGTGAMVSAGISALRLQLYPADRKADLTLESRYYSGRSENTASSSTVLYFSN